MEQVVELAPSRQKDMPSVAAARPDSDRVGRPSRRSRRTEFVGRRPGRNRQEAARLRADLREFEWALARWTR
jgi:hypothetical protein